jgi:2-phospho-L-lactate transferase/gluconeogenesis factor (CofD/UPF0052 family)
VRLIPSSQTAIHALLNHRLSSSSSLALSDWQDIVAGTSPIWSPIPPPTRELLRSMLNHVNFEILKRARPPHSTFNFSSASIGNLFLTGARLFTGSFESAIHLLALVCGISPDRVGVIPAINSNFTHHISAGLVDGSIITGQNAISHPSEPTALPSSRLNPASGTSGISPRSSTQPSPTINPNSPPSPNPYSESIPTYTINQPNLDDADTPEDATLPGSLPTLRKAEINFSKSPQTEESLSSRIARVWYINPYGQEMMPAANPKAVSVLRDAEVLIYSIGSLYTSIVPCLILRGIGEAIASSAGLKHKILILNGSLDRETGPKTDPMSAVDFVAAIARAGEESRGWRGDVCGRDKWRRYVTSVVYLEGDGAPKVDKGSLAEAGIECVRCWARKSEDGALRYDATGLVGALEAILGRGERGGERSRRNTMEEKRRIVR